MAIPVGRTEGHRLAREKRSARSTAHSRCSKAGGVGPLRSDGGAPTSVGGGAQPPQGPENVTAFRHPFKGRTDARRCTVGKDRSLLPKPSRTAS